MACCHTFFVHLFKCSMCHTPWLTPSFVYFNCFCIPEVSIPEVSIKWITMGKILVAIQVFRLDFFVLLCFTSLYLVDWSQLYRLVETNFCVQRLEKSFQTILLHVVIFKTILLVPIGIITGLKIF